MRLKDKTYLWLLLWTGVAFILRFTNLTAKPPWTDEFSTLVFSLGNSYRTVPLDRAIALDVLLQPLQINPHAGISQVLQHLLTESNHPPLYFMLAHWWMKLWQGDSGLVSLWAARSLSATFGALSVPAIYFLGLLAFRSRLVGLLSAAFMAVSPYGIFLAQEARHYSLAILWAIASLCCLVVAIRCLQEQTKIPVWLVLCWILVNILGISTHYFFALTIAAEGIVLLALVNQYRSYMAFWRQILVVGIGSAIGSLVWLPVFLQNNSKLTEWIQSSDRLGILALLNPIFQAIAAWITMLSLLPVESPAIGVLIASGVVMLIFFIWALPILRRGLKVQLKQPQTRLMTQVLVGFVASAIALFFFFTYFLGIDLTRGARYNFVYFPAVIVLVAASLAIVWQGGVKKLENKGKTAVAIIWVMGLLSAITVVNNLGYQKYYRPDLFKQVVQQTSSLPVLIATTHKTHVQTGEMMGIAREYKLAQTSTTPQFLLAHQDRDPKTSTVALQKAVAMQKSPFDLWLVNFHAPVELDRCYTDTSSQEIDTTVFVNGYIYQVYHCSK